MSYIQRFLIDARRENIRSLIQSQNEAVRELQRRVIRVDALDQINSHAGQLVQGPYAIELKAEEISAYKIFNQNNNGGSIYSPRFSVSAGYFSRRTVVHLELSGVITQTTGSNQTVTPNVLVEAVGTNTVSSGTALTLASSATPRGFVYTVDVRQSERGGGIVLCTETFVVERVSNDYPHFMARVSYTTLASSASIEQITGFYIRMDAGVTDGRYQLTGHLVRAYVYEAQDNVTIGGGITDNTYYMWRSGAVDDTFIASNAATTNYGTSTSLYVGENSGAVATYRGLLKFTELGNLPPNFVPVSATIYMTVVAAFSSNARTMELYRCLRNWGESTVTWNTYDGSNAWGTAGCGNASTDYDGATVLGSVALIASMTAGTVVAIPFSAAGLAELKKLIDGTYANRYGFLLKMQTENNDAHQYHSSESASPVAAPGLEIYGYVE